LVSALPELPEVESVRRSLLPHLQGRLITRIIVGRSDIVMPATPLADVPAAMLLGQRLASIDRHGKQLILRAVSGRAIGIHLGMTGQCLMLQAGEQPKQSKHIHMRWQLVDDVDGLNSSTAHTPSASVDITALPHTSELLFRDPRRFGELRAFATPAEADTYLARLGPDALHISGEALYNAIHGSNRPIKAALLDQAVLAGVGNIYADESLFTAQIRPSAKACRLSRARLGLLAEAIRDTLELAVAAGGSTLRDYLDANGNAGTFLTQHRVYGRGGQTCVVCSSVLRQTQVAQRTTVYCPVCQRA
jgi:formamidopyrimidine-DNA glycosylase